MIAVVPYNLLAYSFHAGSTQFIILVTLEAVSQTNTTELVITRLRARCRLPSLVALLKGLQGLCEG